MILAESLTGLAADTSCPYTAGDTNPGVGVTITYDGENNITSLTATPTDGGTITISGDPMTFADGATITLASSGTVSFAEKVTTLGALALVRGDDVYRVWTGTPLTTADRTTPEFPDICTNATVTAADINNTWECIHVVATPPNGASRNAAGRFDRIGGSIGSGSFVALNRTTAAFTYSIRVQLSPKGNGLYARCRTGVRSPRRGLYPDLEDNWPTESLWETLASGDLKNARGIYGADSTKDPANFGGSWLGYTSALGLSKIILKRKGAVGGAMHVRFDGGASLGGTTTVPYGMEVVLAISNDIDSATISSAIKGDGDLKIMPIAGGGISSHYREDFLTTSWEVLVPNRQLASVTGMTGEMLGGSQTVSVPARWCHYSYLPAANTAKCQFQYWNGTGVKTVKAELRQNGSNIEIRATGAGYYTGSQYNYNVNEPVDVYNLNNTHTVATNAATGNYGIHKVNVTMGGSVMIPGNLQYLTGGKLTLDGGTGGRLVAIVTTTNGVPAGGEVHVNANAQLLLKTATSDYPAGGKTKFVVHSGGEVRNVNTWQLDRYQDVVLDGGTYDGISTTLYLNYITLSNAVVKGVSPRVAYDNPNQCWYVVGTEPSTIGGHSSLVNVYGYSSAAAARSRNCAFRMHVEDVTDDPGADCTMPRIRGAYDRTTDRADFLWFWFEKYGAGTLKLTDDAKDVRMESRLYGGTLLLAGNNIMTNEVQLLGGNLTVDAGVANNLGALTALKPGTLTVGVGGLLSFDSFAPGAGLQPKAITIDAPMTGNVLQFRTDISTFKGYFRWRDATEPEKFYHVRLDENGYLHPVSQGTIFSFR